ncbi:hypothetical protein AS160_03665 [Marinitoga sp. 38H-ov]|nr:hypothetical protein AS160_03665 [Marinitoga sp. 38H-ov]
MNDKYNYVTIIVSVPDYTPNDSNIYIAGNFNNWNPVDELYKLKKEKDKYIITLKADPGFTMEYKITRGNWETVEKGKEGEEISNRVYTFDNKNNTIEITVYNWRDFVEKGEGNVKHTLTGNIKIINDFYLKELNKKRRIWIYLPPDYETSNKKYPVLYMHDGQNVFDAATSFVGEWEVDETLEKLFNEGKTNGVIIVAIDNGGNDRLNEYSPWKWDNTNIQIAKGQGGEGDKYVDSIVYSLKPYIDSNFRTIQEDTGIMGSSMGGLISLYAAIKYPEIFKKVGALSSAFWFADNKITEYAKDRGYVGDIKVFLYVGGKEGSDPDKYKNDTIEMAELLKNLGYKNVNLLIDENGVHNESYWAKHFEEIFLWLYSK